MNFPLTSELLRLMPRAVLRTLTLEAGLWALHPGSDICGLYCPEPSYTLSPF